MYPVTDWGPGHLSGQAIHRGSKEVPHTDAKNQDRY